MAKPSARSGSKRAEVGEMRLLRVIRAIGSRYRHRRFAVLFFALLVTLAGHSFFGGLLPAQKPSEWLLALAIAGTLVSGGARPRALMVLGAILAFARLPQSWIEAPDLQILTQALWAGACLLATIVTVRIAFRHGRVDSERIFAVLSAYMLTGLVFGIAYALMSEIWPGSFSLPSQGTMRFEHGVYVSFVILTSLGLGDILPVTGIARGLTVVEAVVGQMYMAVLVARLVSLYSAEEFYRYMEERETRRSKP